MRNFNNIEIKELIIHRADNTKGKEQLVLSELGLLEALNKDQAIQILDVVTGHAMNAMKDKKNRQAFFLDKEINEVYNASSSVFNNEVSFIEVSHILTRRLFQFMRGNSNISAADLVFLLFIESGNLCLGMLKLDYKDHYMSEVKVDDNGKRFLTLSHRGVGWPELGTRLQKAMFILPEIQDQEFQLYVLDRQTRRDSDDIAVFFAEQFLNIQLIADEFIHTKGFINFTRDFVDANEIPPVKAQKIKDAARNLVITAKEIDIEEFSNMHFGEGSQEVIEYMDFLSSKGLTRMSFTKDTEYAEVLTKKVRIQGTWFNLDLTDYTAYKDESRFELTWVDESSHIANITLKNARIKKVE
ncbi:nucleoid-associated protein [Bacillus horti]|uniref:Nucleoid-associated protein n=1 Tax=Caldalkalibacillus horti TaxID=77523 RepID=A0ABT9VYU7_9BACI|nr:nucleoid-associated protein [Bacillus horti]MDQ0166139.1 hypothetical protein [Bacillus horti]